MSRACLRIGELSLKAVAIWPVRKEQLASIAAICTTPIGAGVITTTLIGVVTTEVTILTTVTMAILIMDITDTHTMDMAIITTIIAQEITIMSPIVHMVEITMAEAEEELS